MISLDDILARLENVRRSGSGWVARCPAHEDRSPSLSISVGEHNRPLLYCHASCTYGAIIDALGGLRRRRAFRVSASGDSKRDDANRRRAQALLIWRETLAAQGTLVNRYLEGRGITLAMPPVVRFHPLLRHPTGVRLPAMVAAVEHPSRDGEVFAIHRTWLRLNGSGKADLEPQKAALGPIGGGAVRLAAAAERLCLCEGIEDGLSILQAARIPVWATLGTANFSRVRLPASVREVILCADADKAGERAAHQASERLLHEGRRVRIARPAGAKDFNEMRA